MGVEIKTSIEVRQKDKQSSGFSMGDITLPDLKSKSNAIKIDTSNKNMEKKKEEKIEKKKEVKFYHEWLTESWYTGIRNRTHTHGEDAPYQYYCPICCVAELLKIPTGDHDVMISMMRASQQVKFFDHQVSVSIPGIHEYLGRDAGDNEIAAMNEIELAYSIASMFCDHQYSGQTLYMNNSDVAQCLKEQLYDGKRPPELPERETRNIFDDPFAVVRQPLGSHHVAWTPTPVTFTMSDLKQVLRPSLSFEDDEDES